MEQDRLGSQNRSPVKQTKLEFVFAKPADEAVIKSLLAECSLPHEDIRGHLRHFIVFGSKGNIVGVVGLEVLGSVGLLRSLAVKESHRRKGLGKTLCEKMEGYAASQGIKTLYLLTRNAEGFFKKMGYREVERTAAPGPIQKTKEFSTLCPETAACLVKEIDFCFDLSAER